MDKLFTTECVFKFCVIKCPNSFDRSAAVKFESESKEWISKKASNFFIVDFSKVEFIDSNAYRAIINFKKKLETKEAEFYSINLSKKLYQEIHSHGMIQALSVKKSLEDILSSEASTETDSKAILSKIITELTKAIPLVLNKNIGIELSVGEPVTIKTEKQSREGVWGAALILAPRFDGSISLFCTNSIFLKLQECLSKQKHEIIDRKSLDGMCEVINMIYTRMKTNLNESANYKIQSTFPFSFKGKDLAFHIPGRNTVVSLPIQSQIGDMTLELSVHSKKS